MKKCFSFVGVIAVAAISLVSCSKEVDSPAIELVDEGIPFQIVANPATKTSISGWQTSWAANDKINLFHAVNSTTTYVADGEFTIASEDLATGTFKGTVASPAPTSGNTYDWYAIYPSNDYIKSVHNVDVGDDKAARYYIGKRSDQAQVQTGNSSTDHLSGTNYPLFGKATSVAYDAVPAVTLSHLSSFVEVKVTNKNDDPLTVTSVAFKAPSGTEIVGYFNIDFEADPIVFTPYSTYTSNVANLTVSAGSAIAKDASASFYLGIKPFSIEADAEHPVTLTISVNGYEKDLVLKKNVSFESSKYKTVNFDYDYTSGSTTLFHESFGNNTGSARVWNDSYSVKSGVSEVYSGITGYTISNAKQSKNTVGSTQSGLVQTTKGTDAFIIIGPLNVATAENMVLTYQWKAASIKETYSTSLYYATSSGGEYTEVSGTGAGATSFVERSYNLPAAAQVSTLYLKIVWNTSNTQGVIDEVNLEGN